MGFKELTDFLRVEFGIEGDLVPAEGGFNNRSFFVEPRRAFVKCYSNPPAATSDLEALALETLEAKGYLLSPKFIRTKSGLSRSKFGAKTVSCFSILPGERKYSLVAPPNRTAPIENMGATLATLHSALNPKPGKPGKSNLLKYILALPRDPRLTRDAFETELAVTERAVLTFEEQRSPLSLIHGDYQPGNLLFVEDQVSGVVDFEYAAYDFAPFDIAMSLSNLLSGRERDRPPSAIIEPFLSGYENVTGQRVERSLLHALIRGSWLLNLGWIQAQRTRRVEIQRYRDQTLLSIIEDAPMLAPHDSTKGS